MASSVIVQEKMVLEPQVLRSLNLWQRCRTIFQRQGRSEGLGKSKPTDRGPVKILDLNPNDGGPGGI